MRLLTPTEKLLILESKCLPKKEIQRVADLLKNKFRFPANRQSVDLISTYLGKVVLGEEGEVDRSQEYIKRIAKLLDNANTELVAKEIEKGIKDNGVYEFKIPANLLAKAKELGQAILDNGFSFKDFKEWLEGTKSYKEDAETIMKVADISSISGLYTQLLAQANDSVKESAEDEYRNIKELAKAYGVDLTDADYNELSMNGKNKSMSRNEFKKYFDIPEDADEDPNYTRDKIVNEGKMQIKRPYKRGGVELSPAVTVAEEAVIRNKIVKFLGSKPLFRASKTDLNDYFNSMNEDAEVGRRPSNSWLYRNTHLVKKIRIGKDAYYKLTRAGLNLFNKIKESINEVAPSKPVGYEIFIESDDDTIADMIEEFDNGILPDNVAPVDDNSFGIIINDEDDRKYVDGVIDGFRKSHDHAEIKVSAWKHEKKMELKSHAEMMNEGLEKFNPEAFHEFAANSLPYCMDNEEDRENAISAILDYLDGYDVDKEFVLTVLKANDSWCFDSEEDVNAFLQAAGLGDVNEAKTKSGSILKDLLGNLNNLRDEIDATPEGEVKILIPHYSINVQSKYEDGEELQYELDEVEDELGCTLIVNDYDDLVADPHGVLNEAKSNKRTVVAIDPPSRDLTIKSSATDLNDLMDDLGDNDIISANEINSGQYDYLILSNAEDAYDLTDRVLKQIFAGEQVTISKEADINDIVEKDNPDHQSFMKWLIGEAKSLKGVRPITLDDVDFTSVPLEIQQLIQFADKFELADWEGGKGVLSGKIKDKTIFSANVDSTEDQLKLLSVNGKHSGKAYDWDGDENLKITDISKVDENTFDGTSLVENPTREQTVHFQAMLKYLEKNYKRGSDYDITTSGAVRLQKSLMEKGDKQLMAILQNLDVTEPKMNEAGAWVSYDELHPALQLYYNYINQPADTKAGDHGFGKAEIAPGGKSFTFETSEEVPHHHEAGKTEIQKFEVGVDGDEIYCLFVNNGDETVLTSLQDLKDYVG